MTREEAIKILIGEAWICCAEKWNEALGMAIKSLEQEPKPGYISIDDAMSAFDDFMCNDIEPEGQEVFLKLLKDRAERSEE